MSTITSEHKREYREAHAEATAGIERLNRLFEETGRTYRARLVIATPSPEPDDFDEDEGDQDPAERTERDEPADGGLDRPAYRIGDERREDEDEMARRGGR